LQEINICCRNTNLNMVGGVVMSKQEILKTCAKCHLGKMHKISLNESFTDEWKCDECGYTESKSPFDIIIEDQTGKK
jgi:ribosomal protein S27AE